MIDFLGRSWSTLLAVIANGAKLYAFPARMTRFFIGGLALVLPLRRDAISN
jgi:hypothetical protein